MEIDVRVSLDDEDGHKDAQKFDQLQSYLKEKTNGERYGNAQTARIAVRLGHEKMQEIKEEREESIKEFKKYEKKIERMTE